MLFRKRKYKIYYFIIIAFCSFALNLCCRCFLHSDILMLFLPLEFVQPIVSLIIKLDLQFQENQELFLSQRLGMTKQGHVQTDDSFQLFIESVTLLKTKFYKFVKGFPFPCRKILVVLFIGIVGITF